ncbi:MAG TPA: PIN domain-containing protein [Abditibacteriaceae bacterium]|jgi:predicted nucleic acid-binding protein
MLNGTAISTQGRVKTKVCIDSSVFSTLFAQEDEQGKLCRALLGDARDGRIECFVSALALVECEQGSGAACSHEMVELFESDLLIRCNVDPFNAELARRLRDQMAGEVTLEPTVWLWLATALMEECDYLMTYNRRLLKCAGHPALGKLKVCVPARPWDAGQLSMDALEGVLPVLPLIDSITRRSVTI